MAINITLANAVEWANAYDGPLFHALLCDPPYHLSSIVERFGKNGAAPAQHGTDGAFARASRGFMGREWDGGDVAFRPETWAAFGRIMHPGAFGMAFASTRGWHRMAVAIEDAGFIIHPVIMCWAFGSGFPKATRLDTQIDRAAGVDPLVVGSKKHQPKFAAADFGYREKDNGFNSKDRERFDLTSGATPLARAWGGHRYGGQALKPALEPIIVFQKPYQGRPIDCITRTGAGAINVDGGRIGNSKNVPASPRRNQDKFFTGLAAPAGDTEGWNPDMGRWPSNLILSHHPSCNGSCVELCPVRRLGEQSGESSSSDAIRHNGEFKSVAKGFDYAHDTSGYDDSGTAARYFYNADWMAERLEDSDPVIYQAKASTVEREAGLEDFESVTINDGRLAESDRPYLRNQTQRRNPHPTIKPLALVRHLATLLLPPAEYGPRRLFVPFAGVASEMIGAMLAGWEDIQGIELEADHIPVAEARLAYWQARKGELSNPATPIKVKATTPANTDQMSLFDQPVPTFEEWYHGHDGNPGTKTYGGTREEYDRIYS